MPTAPILLLAAAQVRPPVHFKLDKTVFHVPFDSNLAANYLPPADVHLLSGDVTRAGGTLSSSNTNGTVTSFVITLGNSTARYRDELEFDDITASLVYKGATIKLTGNALFEIGDPPYSLKGGVTIDLQEDGAQRNVGGELRLGPNPPGSPVVTFKDEIFHVEDSPLTPLPYMPLRTVLTLSGDQLPRREAPGEVREWDSARFCNGARSGRL